MSGTLKVGGKTLATHDTAENEISFHSDVMATTAQVQGVYTTATTAKATNANQLTSVTAVSGYSLADVSVGDYVTGEGIRVGTTVSAISGTTITLYHPDGDALSSSMTDLSGDPVSFYNSTKALSAGTVAGQLCRAWVKFDSSGVILSAFNISSVTDESGTFNDADYTINFTTAMPDADYVITGAGQSPATQAYYASLFGVDSSVDPTTSQCRVTYRTVVNAASNFPEINLDLEPDFGYVAIFR